MEITTEEAQLIHALMVYSNDAEGMTKSAIKVWGKLYSKLEKEWGNWNTDKFKVWE